MSRIVMIGGHGKVALLAAPLLVEAGHEVVSLIRNPDQSADVAATGATPLVLSVEEADVAELTRVFAGAGAIVRSAGAGGKGSPERTDAVDRAAAIRSMEARPRSGSPATSWSPSSPPTARCPWAIRCAPMPLPRSRQTGTSRPPTWTGRSWGRVC